MSLTVDRRGEAHLWLLLEESLAAVRHAGLQQCEEGAHHAAWRIRRDYRYVADALAGAGVVRSVLAAAMSQELDDALALRGLAGLGNFAGQVLPVQAVVANSPPARGAEVWLEAEIEKHLDLLTDFDPSTRPGAGVEALRILSGPVRAFLAAGALDPGCSLVPDLAQSITAAGFDPPVAKEEAPPLCDLVGAGGQVRQEWVKFVREWRGRSDDRRKPPQSRSIRQPLGVVGGRTVALAGLDWSFHTLHVKVCVGRREDRATGDDRAPWSARVLGDRGRLHLGPPNAGVDEHAATAHFRLRPGVEPAAKSLQLRITAGGERLEATVAL